MAEGEAECAVQRFSEANFSRISNKSGFFMGIIRRVKEDGPDKGSGDLDILPRPVRYRLRDLLDDVSPCPSARPIVSKISAKLCNNCLIMPGFMSGSGTDPVIRSPF